MSARLTAPLLAAVLLLGASGSSTAPVVPGPHVTQTVLGNGMRVVVVENHAVPLANVAMWYRFGSADDPPGHHGLAHALEHMMFRGTRALSGAGIDLVHARLGIEANAETDYESTHYYQTVPVDALEVALHVEADRMHGLSLRQRDWELERGAVLAELSSDASSASNALESAVRRAAYGASPFAHDRAGTERDVSRTTAADLRRAYEAAYQPDNATLVVTGDVSPAAVARLVRTLFGPLHGHARIVHPPAAVPAARGFTVRLGPFPEAALVDVALAVHGERALDSTAEEVTAELLGPEHAPLRDALTGRNGPCLSYELDDDRVLDGGLYHLACRVEFGVKPGDAIGTIRRALRRLAAHPPSAADVAYARRADVASAAFSRDSLSGEADYFGGNIALLRTAPQRWEADIPRVSQADVASVLRRWAEPVGYGIATPGGSLESNPAPERRERLEHVTPVLEGPAVEPPWARIAPRGLRTDDVAAVDAFALANGVRVFVEPRRGNGTAYLRAPLDRARAARVSRAFAHARRARIAEQHAIVIDEGANISVQGFTRELPTMLRLIADALRTPGTRPDAAWIAVTGDVDPLAVRARTAEIFGGWHGPARPEPSASPLLAPAKSQRFTQPMVIRIGTSSVRTLLVQSAPGRDDPDRPAMALLDEVLGGDGAIDARLGTEVRRRRGLAYTVGTLYDADDGRFLVFFEAPRGRFRAARAAVRDVIRAARTNLVTSEELERARHKLLASALRDESNPAGILDRLSTAAREHRSPDDLQTLAARYDAVTLDDVRRVARTRLKPDAMVEFDEGPVP